jgi:hypothetical protein
MTSLYNEAGKKSSLKGIMVAGYPDRRIDVEQR